MKAPKSELVSRAGVHYVGYVFSTEGIIFRETLSTDVGVDGQLELVSPDGIATGMFVGVQVKSGDSFVDSNTEIFSFKASKDNFSYWQTLRMPAIGVVYSPTLKVASWFDLTKHAEDILINNKPLVIRQKLSRQNIVKIGSGLNELMDLTYSYYKLPLTKKDIEKIDSIRDSDRSTKPSNDDSWKRLISAFFASDSEPEVIYDVGYRLSWYFPSVSENQKSLFKNRVQLLTLLELDKIFRAIKLVIDGERDDVARLIVDLISYKPDITEMLNELNSEGFVSSEDEWLLEQIKDYLAEF